MDLADILTHSANRFGAVARRRYERLIEVAIADLLEDPARATTADRPELGAGTRSYHLRHVRRRAVVDGAMVHDPRHLIVFRFDAHAVMLVRVLHDAMELSRHIPPQD